MGISGIYAFTNTSTSTVKNDLNTGAVNIQLKEYSINNNVEQEYNEDPKAVMPGEVVSLIPRVLNLGESCYVRAKISYKSNSGNLILSDENIEGMDPNWTKTGDYWYYSNPIETDAKIDIFKSVSIPSDISNENQGKTLQVNIVVEAIQSRNFTPDFTSDEPWGNVEITEGKDNNYHTDKSQISNNVIVEYENGTNNYIEIPEDFLSNISLLMPGDNVSSEITVKPTNDKTEVSFTVAPESNDDEEIRDLMEKLVLKIESNGETVFTGNLYQLNETTFGSSNSNTETKYKFSVSMPEELGNEYSMLSTGLVWTFKAKTEVTPKPIDYTNTYTVEIVTVKEDGTTVILSNDTIYTINGGDKITSNGKIVFPKDKTITALSQRDTYTIKQKNAPAGYKVYPNAFDLIVGFKIDESIQKYVIDESKTYCSGPGIADSMYKISPDNTKITIYIPNEEIEKPRKGDYQLELVVVGDDGQTVITTDKAIFTINDSNLGTKEGILNIKKIIGEGMKNTTFSIKQKKAPNGYNAFIGTINLNVGFKYDEKTNSYIIDESSTNANSKEKIKFALKVSGDKVIIYITNTKKPEPQPSPQTGDVKVKIAIAIFIIAAICLIVVFILERKNKNKENEEKSDDK